MVFQKRLNCVASGHQIPAIPTVPSSAKRKRSARKKVEVNQLSAIDLLASLAGKLLAEGEGFWTPSKEQVHNESPFKGGALDQASCDESRFAPLCVSHGRISGTKQHLKSMEGRLSECQASENGDFGKKLFACGSMDEFTTKSIESTSPMESCVCKVDNETLILSHGKQKTSTSLICHDSKNMFNIKCPIDPDRTPPVPVSSDSSVELPPCANYSRAWNDGRELHVDKDVGENSSVSTPPNSIHLKAFKPHCLEIHRKRKFSNSNYIKADPARFNDGEVSNDDFKIKPVLRNRKLFYAHQGTHGGSSKRRKLFDHCSDSPSYGISHDETLQDSLENDGFRLEPSSLLEDLNGAKDNSGTKICSNSIYSSEDLPVKLSIKSFKVPELFIEIPANATVGSLKRTVMEAVMAVLGGGLRVGVLFKGKKVRDDSKTLQQAGISYAHKTDGLGFTLEPSPSGTPAPRNNHKESTFIISEPDPNNKFQASSDATFQLPQITIPTTDCIENGHENPAPENMDYFSKALVPVTALNSIIPLCKLRRSATAQQRRIRRPFSVSEVEALVQAVEKIGTGRWRDVKLQAFDNAKHRTYVDLKDKWKTLVHTAKISPQQRRGEPVPQDLLDRVLSTHSYWSHLQAKLPDPPEQRLLLNHA